MTHIKNKRYLVAIACISFIAVGFLADEALAIMPSPPKGPQGARPSLGVNVGYSTAGLVLFEAPELKQLAQELVKTIRQAGFEKLGDLDLAEVAAGILDLNYAYAPVFILGSGEYKRISSIYIVEKKQVVFSGPRLSHIDLDLIPYFLLHETLGALGYPDDDYQLTLSLYGLMHPQGILIPAWMFEGNFLFLNRTAHDPVYLAGGVTSIGGGGDDIAFRFKLESLVRGAAICRHVGKNVDQKTNQSGDACARFLNFILNAKVESNWHVGVSQWDMGSNGHVILPAVYLFLSSNVNSKFEWSAQPEIWSHWHKMFLLQESSAMEGRAP